MCGTVGVYAGVNPASVQQVLGEIRREIDRFVKDGITEREYRDTMTQMRAGLLMGLESPGGRMQSMGRALLLRNRVLTLQERVAMIDAVTPETIMDSARKALTAEPCIALLGPDAEALRL